MENNEASPDMTNLIKLATIFEVSLDQLVLGKILKKQWSGLLRRIALIFNSLSEILG